MDQRQIDLVQHSFDRAVRVGPHVAATFYSELFVIDPALRAMFKGDMVEQGEKLMATLRLVVSGLHDPETIAPLARDLAVQHLNYGVEAHHYAAVGTALLRTLKHELASEFTPEMRTAWTAAYQWLADTMRKAAYGSAQTYATSAGQAASPRR